MEKGRQDRPGGEDGWSLWTDTCPLRILHRPFAAECRRRIVRQRKQTRWLAFWPHSAQKARRLNVIELAACNTSRLWLNCVCETRLKVIVTIDY